MGSTDDRRDVDAERPGVTAAGDVMHAVGRLDEATDHLDDDPPEDTVDPVTVGQWITVIGKAILAIFKP